VAELVSELIANPELLPLSLGVFGGWGVGKSSTLRLVEAELNENADRFLLIHFDAWLYQDFDDARAALMSVIASSKRRRQLHWHRNDRAGNRQSQVVAHTPKARQRSPR
jgi:hypothetical protein